jgi:hypothetical protein
VLQRWQGNRMRVGVSARLAELTRIRAAVVVVLLVVVAVMVATLLSQQPPDPVPASAPPQQFSAERAAQYLEEFATDPRPLGSAASDRARDYLVGVLRSAGLSVRIDRGIGGRTVEWLCGVRSRGQHRRHPAGP